MTSKQRMLAAISGSGSDAANDDHEWVHELLHVVQCRKIGVLQSTSGARYDLLEHGGGDGSASVISTRMFDLFVAPHDAPLVEIPTRPGSALFVNCAARS